MSKSISCLLGVGEIRRREEERLESNYFIHDVYKFLENVYILLTHSFNIFKENMYGVPTTCKASTVHHGVRR